MTIAARESNRVMISGPNTYIHFGSANVDTTIGYRAGAAITPGDLIEEYDVSGENKWRRHGTATEMATMAVALDKPEEPNNTGLEDDYAANENVEVGFLLPGAVFNARIPSGQNISNSELLQSNGDGQLVTASATTQDAMLGRFRALKNLGSIATETRCPVRFLG